MQNTHNLQKIADALIDLIGILHSPQGDDALLREAGVSLDRALFPLLVGLGARGPLSVAELADLAGRDYTTVSRQLAKLESLALVARREDGMDRRRRTTSLTADGRKIVRAIVRARLRLLSEALVDWSEADRAALATMNRRFVDDLGEYARKRRGG